MGDHTTMGGEHSFSSEVLQRRPHPGQQALYRGQCMLVSVAPGMTFLAGISP